MASGSGKRSRDEMASVSQVPQAAKIIENVQKTVGSVWSNKYQCKRIADRFKAIGEGLKQLDKDFVSGKTFDRSNIYYPAFDELLTVLRKGEALVSSNQGLPAIYTVLSRTDNREAFKEIHDELDTMKARFLFEEVGVSGDFELTTGHERDKILTNDAEKDLKEMKGLRALQKSVDGLSPIDECTLSEKLGDMNLERVKKVVSEKSENREASDGLPSYLDIDIASIETNAQPIREHVRRSTQDPVETFSWALVRSGRWLGCEFAVKVFKSGQSTWDRSELVREVGNLMELRHPHIVRFIGFAQGPEQCCVLMELMDSDLKSFMKSRSKKIPFSHSEELNIIIQIAQGMLYLHTQGYVHEDLKCSNILVKSYGDYIEVKIGDLRNAKKLASIGDQYSTHCSRRPRWTALEAIKKYDGQKPSDELLRKSDVYSFAMTCYEVVTRKLPFQDIQGDELMAMIEAGERPELPADLNEELRGLITSCWDSDPNKRPEFEDICHVLGIIRSSKPHAATDESTSRKESKVVGLFKAIPRVITVFNGLLAGVQRNEPANESPEPASESTVGEEIAIRHPVDDMDVDGSSGIKFPDYLKIKPATLQKVRRVGYGASAEVWEVIWLGCRFAMKTFKPSTPIPKLQQELDFLVQLRHPYIIQMVGLSVGSNQQCSIVMEFMRGSLRHLIKSRMDQKRTVPFDLDEALEIIRKIALGMAFLHSRGVLHRDLKGTNVLCQELADCIDVKIVDFGMSQHIQHVGGSNTVGVGTGFWRAPEVLPTDLNRSGKCDLKKADVYSFGMTCFEVLTGKVPFVHLKLTDYDEVISGGRPELPYHLNSGLNELIAKCWHADPEERPDFPQICEELLTIQRALRSSTS